MKEQVTICIWKKLFGLLYPTWKNFSEKIFSNGFFICFEWKYCAVSQNVIFMSFIYLHFSNCKFLTFCSIDWFRFQKPLAIGPFRIPRCQDFWDKSLGWFLGFQSILRCPTIFCVYFHNTIWETTWYHQQQHQQHHSNKNTIIPSSTTLTTSSHYDKDLRQTKTRHYDKASRQGTTTK